MNEGGIRTKKTLDANNSRRKVRAPSLFFAREFVQPEGDYMYQKVHAHNIPSRLILYSREGIQ